MQEEWDVTRAEKSGETACAVPWVQRLNMAMATSDLAAVAAAVLVVAEAIPGGDGSALEAHLNKLDELCLVACLSGGCCDSDTWPGI